jgi:hemerythrin superfamily protein
MAIRLLKQDHQEVSQLLERFENASGAQKTQIAQRICRALTVHAQIEEELLYPAARRALEEEDQELVAEAAVEHASVKDLVGQIEGAAGSDELYDAKVKVLGEYVKHHVKEEETELFPKLQKTQLDLDALGEQLAARKSQLASEIGMAEPADDESDLASNLNPSRSGGNRGSRPSASR